MRELSAPLPVGMKRPSKPRSNTEETVKTEGLKQKPNQCITKFICIYIYIYTHSHTYIYRDIHKHIDKHVIYLFQICFSKLLNSIFFSYIHFVVEKLQKILDLNYIFRGHKFFSFKTLSCSSYLFKKENFNRKKSGLYQNI